MQENQIIDAVSTWLDQVVIGLNLCPFAAKPRRENKVRIALTSSDNDEALLLDLKHECEFLRQELQIETSLLILTEGLRDFWDYNQFLIWANQLLRREGFEGEFQIASFHPDYCFAGADPDDAGNLTNRSPWPILHLIREASLEKALQYFPDIESVPEKNQRCVESLTQEQKKKLFPYLFS